MAQTNAGSYAVSASCDGVNYTDSGSATLVIAKASGTVTFGTLSFVFDTTLHPTTAFITEESATTCSVSYVSGTAPVNAGSYAVSATCVGMNYTATGNATLTITKAIGSVSFGTVGFTYDGNAHTVAATLNEEPGATCTLSGPGATAQSNVGSYAASASCVGANYTASGNTTLTISKASGTLTFGMLGSGFDGTPHPTTAFIAQEPATTCALVYAGGTTPVAAGSYLVTATCAGSNYNASGTATLVISAKPVSITLSGTGNFTYDNADHSATASVAGVVSGFPAGVTLTYNGSSTVPHAAGSYIVLAMLDNSSSNYVAMPTSGLIVITPTALALNVTGPQTAVAGTPLTGYDSHLQNSGGTSTENVRVNFVLSRAGYTLASTDITLEYDLGGGTFQVVPVAACGANLCGFFGASGGLTVPTGYDVSTALRLTYLKSGSVTVAASVDGVASGQHFAISALTVQVAPGAAATIAASGPTAFSGAAGAALASLPAVIVTDANGNPVTGATVNFAVSGGGSIGPSTATTNGSGIASLSSWTLAPTPGSNTVTASDGLSGSPVTFTATGTATTGLDITLSAGGHSYAQYGKLLTYVISVTNAGPSNASAVQVSDALPAGVDSSTATWICVPSTNAACTRSGTGNLSDSGSIPVSGSLTYVITTHLSSTTTSDQLSNTATASNGSDNRSATSNVQIVIFRDGLEQSGNGADSPQAALGALAAAAALEMDFDTQAVKSGVTSIALARSTDARSFRIEAFKAGDSVSLRLVASDANGESVSAWTSVGSEFAHLQLQLQKSGDRGASLHLHGADQELQLPLSNSAAFQVYGSAALDQQ